MKGLEINELVELGKRLDLRGIPNAKSRLLNRAECEIALQAVQNELHRLTHRASELPSGVQP